MKFEFEWDGKMYDCEWFDETDFERLDNVVQAYGFLFDDEGKICIVNVRHNEDGWCLPGGGPEDCDDSFEDTLIREVDEEADLDICDIKKIGYVKVFPKGEPDKVGYMVRYVGKVKRVRDQTIDPAHGKIPLRKFVSKDEFMDNISWSGNGVKVQLKKALEVFEKNKERVGQVEVIVYRKVGDGHEFLMMKRIESKGGFWQPVTGGIEVGEDIEDAARREVLEETGFDDVKLTKQVHGFVLEKDNLPEYVFGAEVCCGSDVCIDNNIYPEHEDVRWCGFNEAMELLFWENNKEGLRKLALELDCR